MPAVAVPVQETQLILRRVFKLAHVLLSRSMTSNVRRPPINGAQREMRPLWGLWAKDPDATLS